MIPNPVPLAVKIGAGLLALALVIFAVWRFFFADHQGEQKAATVRAAAEQVIQKADVKAQAAAVPIIVKNFNTSAAIDAQTQEAIREALKSKGAAQAVDPGLDDLARRAICVRVSASGLPECQSLLKSSP